MFWSSGQSIYWIRWVGLRFSHGALAAIWCLVLVWPAAAFDFSSWDAMLKKYVTPGTISGIQLNTVAYRQMQGDPEFAKLVGQLATVYPDQLKTRAQKLSFWINVYNIMAVKIVLDHYPVKSIKNAGSFFTQVWQKPVGVVAGKERTLNEIEHAILRKMDEPRIHVAIVCASVSCPDLYRDAYNPKGLDAQLDSQLRRFLQNPGKGMRVDRKQEKLYLSSIFKWFGGDFESRGGVPAFIAQYASPQDQQYLQSKKWKVKYLNYNWDLNGF